jgi:hypothetical protein
MSGRKIKRKKELAARKEARKASKKIGQELSKMPKSCGECGTVFNKEDKSMLNWRIAIYDDGPVHLACPDCIPDEVKMQ